MVLAAADRYGVTRLDSAGLDRYGRTLGTVFVDDVNVNAALIEQGSA